MCNLANRFKVPWTIENPLTSIVWVTKQMKNLLRSSRAEEGRFDFCQYGKPWRKATKIVGTVPGLEAASRKCTGKVCSRTALPHVKLEGRNAHGVFWTKIAEPYPEKLCKELSLLHRQASGLNH